MVVEKIEAIGVFMSTLYVFRCHDDV
jgi:hypothetical protein